MQRIKDTKKIFKSPNGAYRTITLISLTKNISTTKLIQNITSFKPTDQFSYNGVPYYDTKSKSNSLLISSDYISPVEILFAIRTSDIVVFFVDNTSDDTNISFYKKHLPSFLFCVMEVSERKTGLCYANKYFGSDNVVAYQNLFEKLANMKMYPTTVRDNRPYFVPNKFFRDGNMLHVEGFMQKGFLSRYFMINGSIRCKLINLVAEDIEYEGYCIDENASISEFYNKNVENGKNIDDEHYENEKSYENNTESVSMSESSSNDDNEIVDTECSLIHQYRDYRGIKNLNTCDFVTNNYPEHYSDIYFFEQIKNLESKIKKMKSKLPDDILIRAKFLVEDDLDFNFVAFFNYFEFEDVKSICNVEFSCDSLITSDERYIVDLGWKFINIVPLVSYNSQAKVHRVVEALQSGIMSFIAPLSLLTNKIIIYKELISSQTLLGTGHNLIYKDRIMLDEALIQGNPHKIDKRYCTVRNMFRTKDEVMFFRNIELRTKNKVTGIIKKPIGTHGVFKAYFSACINHGDIISVPLYKRRFLMRNE